MGSGVRASGFKCERRRWFEFSAMLYKYPPQQWLLVGYGACMGSLFTLFSWLYNMYAAIIPCRSAALRLRSSLHQPA